MRKRITISFDDFSDDEAIRYAYSALQNTAKDERKGAIVFKDRTVLWFRERTKNLSMTLIREMQ